MCTDIRIKSSQEDIVIGRTMEFAFQLNDHLSAFERGKSFEVHDNMGEVSLSWIGKYHFMAIHTQVLEVLSYKNGIYDAINEKGLSIEALLFSDFADYGEVSPDETRPLVPINGLILWLISNFETVADVKENITNIKVWAKEEIYLGNKKPEFHFAIHDATGASIVVEFINGGELKIHDNIACTVTNNPTYDWHIHNLKNYFTLSPYSTAEMVINDVEYKSLSQGNGLVGIPGDYSSPSRFVKMTYLNNFKAEIKTSKDAVLFASHCLNNVEIPLGSVRKKILKDSKVIDAYEKTEWKIIKDLTNQELYVSAYGSLGYVKVDLNSIWENPLSFVSKKITDYISQNL
jgi:choloylglycine hydrolase